MDNRKTSQWYITWVMFFVTTMFAGTAFVGMASHGFVSSLFHLICSLIYIYGWQAIARRSPELMPKYFLAASALRLMAAATVLLVFCVVNRGDIETIKWFAIVFIVFYLVILAFDAVFFAKVSNNKKVTK